MSSPTAIKERPTICHPCPIGQMTVWTRRPPTLLDADTCREGCCKQPLTKSAPEAVRLIVPYVLVTINGEAATWRSIPRMRFALLSLFEYPDSVTQTTPPESVSPVDPRGLSQALSCPYLSGCSRNLRKAKECKIRSFPTSEELSTAGG